MADYDSAISHDQTQYNYYLDRGKLKFELEDPAAAIMDFQFQ